MITKLSLPAQVALPTASELQQYLKAEEEKEKNEKLKLKLAKTGKLGKLLNIGALISGLILFRL